MPSTIGKCKLFRIKHITLLEGETFLRNKHEIAFFEIKCTFFGRKENTIRMLKSEKIINYQKDLFENSAWAWNSYKFIRNIYKVRTGNEKNKFISNKITNTSNQKE